MRGSDPDAAVYWLARMLEAGEDPRFIARRMVIFASEDVGMADPQALVVAVAAAHALEFVGLPEAQLNLSQAVIHLATAPKSNASALAVWNARADVAAGALGEVPAHLRDAHYRGAAEIGHGVGYEYPHAHDGGRVDQHYLPDELAGRTWYHPTDTASRSTQPTMRTTLGDVSAGELALVVGAVLCALAFAALAVTLVRVRDTVADLRDEVVSLRTETRRGHRRAARVDGAAAEAVATARADLDRFDRLLGSAEAISSAVGRGNRVGRAALSAPMIKAAGIATGTSRAVRRLRSDVVMRRVVWFVGGVATGAAGAGYAKRKVSCRRQPDAPVQRRPLGDDGAAARRPPGRRGGARGGHRRPAPRGRAAGRARRATGPPRATTSPTVTRCSSTARSSNRDG